LLEVKQTRIMVLPNPADLQSTAGNGHFPSGDAGMTPRGQTPVGFSLAAP
jgi:hypothetical protein